MRVIPVIDLRGGWVVHASGGRRETYRPVVSCLAGDARPSSIARGIVERLSSREVYVADLDALAGGEPDWASLAAISGAGLALWLDVGPEDAAAARRVVAGAARHRVTLTAAVSPLERLADPHELPAILADLGPAAAAFSLDLRDGRPLTTAAAWHAMTVLEIAHCAWEAGFRRMLVLDVARVGRAGGPAVAELCRQLTHRFPGLELLAGGGVRGEADVRLLGSAGCAAALAATALHRGWRPGGAGTR